MSVVEAAEKFGKVHYAVTRIAISFSRGIEVEELPRAGQTRVPNRYLATSATAVVSAAGEVKGFEFTGRRWVKSRGEWSHRLSSFFSDDPALTEAKLVLRRIAAPAATRALSGAK